MNANANGLMGAHADIQAAVNGLMLMVRCLRDGTITVNDVELKMVENGLFEIGHALFEITSDLRTYAANIDAAYEQANALLLRSKELLERCAADASGTARRPPAESFDTDKFHVEIDPAANVVVVRERPAVPVNVVPFTGVFRHPRHDNPTGGAA